MTTHTAQSSWSPPRSGWSRSPLALALAAVLPGSVQAATTLTSVRLTPDTSFVLGSNNQTLTPQDVARHIPGGTATLEAGSPFVGAGVRLTGYHYISATQQWFAFDNPVLLGGITFVPQDVAQLNGGTWSYVLNGATEAIPNGIQVDAVARDPTTGDLLLSFNSTVTLDVLTFDPRDIARYSGGTFSLYRQLSTIVPAGLNLTGLDVLPGGRLLLSFDGSGVLGGIGFDDEDILEYDPNTGVWEMNYDGSAQDPDWPPAQLEAFSVQAAPGILVTPTSGLITTEAGGTAQFQVVLLAPPTSNVTVALSTLDTTEGTPAPIFLTFTPANWNLPQTVTVTGVNDSLTDGAQPYNIITAAAVSSDAAYSGLNPADVALVNLDNDGPGISVWPNSGLITTESGGTDSFYVVLNSQPTANVTINLNTSDATEGTAAPAALVFTPADWNTPQKVTLTGVDDALIDGNIAYTILTAPATSADAAYNGRDAADVAVLNLDNDAPGITVTPTSGLVTTEKGGQASFRVALNTAPTANVTIALSVSDTTEGKLATNSLTFTPANWSVPQTVVVTGVSDNIADGHQAYSVITAQAVSTDPAYSAIDPANVSLTNLDNGYQPPPLGTPVQPIPSLSTLGLGLLSLLTGLVGLVSRRRRSRTEP